MSTGEGHGPGPQMIEPDSTNISEMNDWTTNHLMEEYPEIDTSKIKKYYSETLWYKMKRLTVYCLKFIFSSQ
jgi:hypothetical protein